MKIGIFGDSFANHNFAHSEKSWMNVLRDNHDVSVFGEAGSSILFSAKRILWNYHDYDLIIWCLTGPWRYSIETVRPNIHVYNYDLPYTGPFADFVNTVKKFKKIENREDEMIIGRALQSYVEKTAGKVMTIASVPEVLNDCTNMYRASELELQYFYPDKTLDKILSTHDDIRECHLSPTNNQIFGEYVRDNLSTGLLNIDYSIFVKPNEPIETLLRKK